MTKPLDLRIQRTYKSLSQAMLHLLSQKKFEDITVGEICEVAMIRRATFYKHFGDKYELFSFVIRQFQEEFALVNQDKKNTSHPYHFYIGLIEQTLNFFEEYQDLVQSAMNSEAALILIDLITEQIRFEAEQEFHKDVAAGRLEGNSQVLSLIFSGALVRTAIWWSLHQDQLAKSDILTEYEKVMSAFEKTTKI